MNYKITIKEASKLMGLSSETVRYGIRSQELPIGTAIKISEQRTIYHIPPNRLADYMGITVEQLLKILSE